MGCLSSKQSVLKEENTYLIHLLKQYAGFLGADPVEIVDVFLEPYNRISHDSHFIVNEQYEREFLNEYTSYIKKRFFSI